MRDFIRLITETTLALFSGWKVVFWMIAYAIGVGVYFYFISYNVMLAIFVGVFLSFPFFFAINVQTAQRKKRKHEISALSKYVQTLVFHLKSGRNILHSYEATFPMVDEILHDDLQKVMDTLRYRGTLDVSHFEGYNFKLMNLFHNNLVIKSQHGGRSEEIFKDTTRTIAMELGCQDKLDRAKEYVLMETYMMLGMSVAIPLMLSLTVDFVYVEFTSNPVTMPLLIIYMICVYSIVYFMNKKRSDVSVTI